MGHKLCLGNMLSQNRLGLCWVAQLLETSGDGGSGKSELAVRKGWSPPQL